MTQTASNPLKAFFRQPALYIQLPSKGEGWPPGSLDMPVNNELPVLPMTAMDEITYRTPDALFNGSAVVSVIQSCLPNVKNAWQMPTTDLNTILTAIRIASHGHNLEIDTVCPHCEADGGYTMDMRIILDQMKSPDFSKSLNQGDLEIYFKPVDYTEQNQINQLQFEQQKIIQQLPTADMTDDEKAQRLEETMIAITQITAFAIAKSIRAIKTPQVLVTEAAFIEEFLNNCDRIIYNIIRDRIIEIRKGTDLAPLTVTCDECKKTYDQPFVLDTSYFFANAS
jgi:hypothetical protein